MCGGLDHRHLMICIDMCNIFYILDLETKEIAIANSNREEGTYSDCLCVMKSRDQKYLAASRWDYEENLIEIRDCD